MRLTKIQESALTGMILGDSYLQATGKKNARLRLEHKAPHAEYLCWKARLLPQLFQGKPSYMKRMHPLSKKTYSYVRHQSNSSPVLGRFRRIFYPQNISILMGKIKKFVLPVMEYKMSS